MWNLRVTPLAVIGHATILVNLEGVKLDLPDELVPLVVEALEHLDAYRKCQRPAGQPVSKNRRFFQGATA